MPILTMVGLFAGCGGPAAEPGGATSADAARTEVAVTPPEAPHAEAALWFGGDVFLGASARGGVEDIVAIVGAAPGIVNLEGAVGEGPGAARVDGASVWLENPAEAPAWLRAQGIAAVSIANNHARDPGPDAPAATAARVRAAGGMPFGGPAGAGHLDVQGLAVGLYAHEVEEPGLAAALVAELGAAGEAIRVVSLHVTGAPSYLPSPALTAVVDGAVASGADIVVVHGSHLLGPIERRASARPGGDAIIAWGLGNLLFDCPCTDEAEAIVLRVTLSPDGPGAAEVIPVTAGLGGQPARLARDAPGILDLLDALGGSALTRRGERASF